MLQDILSIGQKVDIKQLDRNGEPMEMGRVYVSQLVDFVDQDMVKIVMPLWNTKVVPLHIGESYHLCFYTNKGLYQCNCLVMKHVRENNVILSLVKITSDLKKYQRRQFYRLECIHETKYRIITKEEKLLEERVRKNKFSSPEEKAKCEKQLLFYSLQWSLGAITDISGGGAKITSHSRHKQGDKLILCFDFILGNELRKLNLDAEIISAELLPITVETYEYRMKFTNISEKDREDLIKYIFEQERQRRQQMKI